MGNPRNVYLHWESIGQTIIVRQRLFEISDIPEFQTVITFENKFRKLKWN